MERIYTQPPCQTSTPRPCRNTLTLLENFNVSPIFPVPTLIRKTKSSIPVFKGEKKSTQCTVNTEGMVAVNSVEPVKQDALTLPLTEKNSSIKIHTDAAKYIQPTLALPVNDENVSNNSSVKINSVKELSTSRPTSKVSQRLSTCPSILETSHSQVKEVLKPRRTSKLSQRLSTLPSIRERSHSRGREPSIENILKKPEQCVSAWHIPPSNKKEMSLKRKSNLNQIRSKSIKSAPPKSQNGEESGLFESTEALNPLELTLPPNNRKTFIVKKRNQETENLNSSSAQSREEIRTSETLDVIAPILDVQNDSETVSAEVKTINEDSKTKKKSTKTVIETTEEKINENPIKSKYKRRQPNKETITEETGNDEMAKNTRKRNKVEKVITEQQSPSAVLCDEKVILEKVNVRKKVNTLKKIQDNTTEHSSCKEIANKSEKKVIATKKRKNLLKEDKDVKPLKSKMKINKMVDTVNIKTTNADISKQKTVPSSTKVVKKANNSKNQNGPSTISRKKSNLKPKAKPELDKNNKESDNDKEKVLSVDSRMKSLPKIKSPKLDDNNKLSIDEINTEVRSKSEGVLLGSDSKNKILSTSSKKKSQTKLKKGQKLGEIDKESNNNNKENVIYKSPRKISLLTRRKIPNPGKNILVDISDVLNQSNDDKEINTKVLNKSGDSENKILSRSINKSQTSVKKRQELDEIKKESNINEGKVTSMGKTDEMSVAEVMNKPSDEDKIMSKSSGKKSETKLKKQQKLKKTNKISHKESYTERRISDETGTVLNGEACAEIVNINKITILNPERVNKRKISLTDEQKVELTKFSENLAEMEDQDFLPSQRKRKLEDINTATETSTNTEPKKTKQNHDNKSTTSHETVEPKMSTTKISSNREILLQDSSKRDKDIVPYDESQNYHHSQTSEMAVINIKHCIGLTKVRVTNPRPGVEVHVFLHIESFVMTGCVYLKTLASIDYVSTSTTYFVTEGTATVVFPEAIKIIKADEEDSHSSFFIPKSCDFSIRNEETTTLKMLFTKFRS